jgi:hypothetical protein
VAGVRTSDRPARPGAFAVLALLGSAWAAFLLPPQLAAWDGTGAALWVQRLEGAAPYDALRSAAAPLGVDDYSLFGMLVAPSFLAVGVALLAAVRGLGPWATATAWLTVLGAPAALLSYGGYAVGEPWDVAWGVEIWVLLGIGVCGTVAGIQAAARRRAARWWCALLAATLVVIVLSSVAFAYFPHGTLVGHGVQVAVLVAAAHRARTRPEAPEPEPAPSATHDR